MYNIPAVIFAGGKSSRMGRDKALLPFGGFQSMSEFQHHKLSSLFKEVFLSSKEDKFNFSCKVIKDNYEESSPLVGLLSAFENMQAVEIFVLSVDAPLVNADVIQTLIEASKTSRSNAIIAKSPNGLQPLCGIYRRSIVPLAQKQLEAHNYRLGHLLKMADTTIVTFEDDKPFTNLNTPQEYDSLFLS